ncbi:hypothetical protein THAOC_07955, partial [Thalassiosira oceanica]
ALDVDADSDSADTAVGPALDGPGVGLHLVDTSVVGEAAEERRSC